MEFLVLPRVVTLVLMMPLLCLCADFMGIAGGAAIGVGTLHLSWTTHRAIDASESPASQEAYGDRLHAFLALHRRLDSLTTALSQQI
jgi:hypothetical protein